MAPADSGDPTPSQLLLAPAERADLIVDFRDVPAGSRLILLSDAPAPYPDGDAANDYYPGNPDTPTATPGIRAQHPHAAADPGQVPRRGRRCADQAAARPSRRPTRSW